MRVFLATSIEEVREIAAPSTSDWSRRDDEMSRRALCWLIKFLRVEKFDRAVARDVRSR
jgi:hypothetical protein